MALCFGGLCNVDFGLYVVILVGVFVLNLVWMLRFKVVYRFLSLGVLIVLFYFVLFVCACLCLMLAF